MADALLPVFYGVGGAFPSPLQMIKPAFPLVIIVNTFTPQKLLYAAGTNQRGTGHRDYIGNIRIAPIHNARIRMKYMGIENSQNSDSLYFPIPSIIAGIPSIGI